MVKSFAAGAAGAPPPLAREISAVSLLGSTENLVWSRDAAGLHVALPAAKPCAEAYALKVVLK